MTSHLDIMTKKPAVETRVRDVALSLAKVNAPHKEVSQKITDQINAAQARVDFAQQEYRKVYDRANEVHKNLMEHRASVLSFSVRNMEKKMSRLADGLQYDSSSQSTPISSSPSTAGIPSKSRKYRFGGAPLSPLAGHADTTVPKGKLSADATTAELEIASLKRKLKVTKDSLTGAEKKQAEMARELSMMQLEKQGVEVMGMDLQETIAALETEIHRLEELDSEVRQLREEKRAWGQERAELKEQAEVLQVRLANMEANTGQVAQIRESNQRHSERKNPRYPDYPSSSFVLLASERPVWQVKQTPGAT